MSPLHWLKPILKVRKNSAAASASASVFSAKARSFPNVYISLLSTRRRWRVSSLNFLSESIFNFNLKVFTYELLIRKIPRSRTRLFEADSKIFIFSLSCILSFLFFFCFLSLALLHYQNTRKHTHTHTYTYIHTRSCSLSLFLYLSFFYFYYYYFFRTIFCPNQL